MNWIERFLARRRVDHDLGEEIAQHLEERTEQLVSEGVIYEEARHQARREFGNTVLVVEHSREVWGFSLLEDLWRDCRFACRQLRRTPVLATTAVLTLVLGIGANTALFSIINAIVLKPLPYEEADDLVQVVENVSTATSGFVDSGRLPAALDPEELIAFRSYTKTLAEAASYGVTSLALSRREGIVRMQGLQVSASLFALLRVRPQVGRLFDTSDERPGAEHVVILSHRAWLRYFAGDVGVFAEPLVLDGARYSAVGVMPRDFQFPDPQTEFWVPLVSSTTSDVTIRYPVIGRLALNVPREAASTDANRAIQHLRNPLVPELNDASDARLRFEVVRLQDRLAAPVRTPLRALMLAALCFLLLCCVTVANLVVARASARANEMAIRSAIGAGPGRLLRQALAEHLVLTLTGAAGGVVLAFGLIRLLKQTADMVGRADAGSVGLSIPRLHEVAVDARALTAALALSILTGIAFGLSSALRYQHFGRRSRRGLATVDRTPSATRARSFLVVAQICLAIVLSISGALLMSSYRRLSAVDPGFDATNVLTFQVSTPSTQSANEAVIAFSNALVSRLKTVPGVRYVGYAQRLPMLQISGGVSLRRSLESDIPADRLAPDLPRPPDRPEATWVSGEFLDALGIRMLDGQGFTDRATAPSGIIVNHALARSGFLGDHPVGALAYIGRRQVEVIGVAADVHTRRLDRTPDAHVFQRYSSDYSGPPLVQPWTGLGPYFAVKSERLMPSLATTIQAIIRPLDATATIDRVETVEQLVADSLMRPRLYASVVTVFAVVGIGLASIGIYGVTAFAVARRTKEIGLRIALGASPARAVSLILKGALSMISLGVALGLVVATAVTRMLDSMLFGVRPLDPISFAFASVLFAIVALLASYVPARHAAALDPATALRCD